MLELKDQNLVFTECITKKRYHGVKQNEKKYVMCHCIGEIECNET